MDIKQFRDWLVTYYDKLIAVILLLGILTSLIILINFVNREKRKLAQPQPTQPIELQKKVTPIDDTFLTDVIKQCLSPFQISSWANRMMVAELRVRCVVCGRPIPYDAEVCPFKNCRAPQPPKINPETKDSDLDGIPDKWEKSYGLNPLNPVDAELDSDKDGFSNLEEYNFATNPINGSSTPPLLAKVRLLKVGRLSMPFSFQGVSSLPDSTKLFLLRNKYTRHDYYVKMGDVVGGYKLVEFEEKMIDQEVSGFILKKDVSVLTVRKNNRDTQLPLGKYEVQGPLAAKLVFLIDDSKYLVQVGDVFQLKKKSYKVIDIQKDKTIVSDIRTGKETSISYFLEAIP